MGSLMIILCWVVVCMVMSLWLVGCSNDNIIFVFISSVGGDCFGIMLSGLDINSLGECIVYNCSYDNIFKGSYSGNIYIVKCGDILFYIVWIMGNDFCDLVVKNNIVEFYSLNVG